MTASSWRNRGHAAYGAFLLHRLSGLALTLFLPAHFLMLGQALKGEGALADALRWTHAPGVQLSEIALVFLLAVHLTGGLRLLLIEFVGWKSDAQKTLIAAAAGAAAFCALAFALNLL
jgi:fumarate reductase subunit D